MKREIKYHKYKPDQIPVGIKLVKEKCWLCDGVKHYMGTYGMTACEKCDNGYIWREVKIYKSRKS